MPIRNLLRNKVPLIILSMAFALTACDDDDNSSPSPRNYTIKVTNLTANQPLSPVAVIAHQSGYSTFVSGQSASVALEHLAEGGSNTEILAEASANSNFLQQGSGAAAIGPGGSETITLSDIQSDPSTIELSILSMLVNTNDAFVALNGYDLSRLNVNDSVNVMLNVYDAGTEGNTEANGTIPGPANGGTGFDASRAGDVNRVYIHPGVVSADDGLATSVLNQSHRFDNPGAMITISRTQ